jgi:superfamily II DNA or RNA helicase/diadenosine tetraphosphate (Ap4A) HIT family hydrolase
VSVFDEVPPSAWLASNDHAFAFRDGHPVSPGHTLVVTRRQVPDWFAATPEERAAVLALVDQIKAALDEELHPDGYNIGFNTGAAAGQTVMHLHVHVIPRYRGDMDDPRGGVRHVIPSRGNYLITPAPLAIGGEHDPFARHVLPLFDAAYDIAVVAAFIQESGLHRIAPALHGALARGARVRIVTGDYLEITQASALELLLDWQCASAGDESDGAPKGRVETRVVEVKTLPGLTRSFHPKSWRFESPRFGIAFVGSSNLSRSALDTGIEWNLRVDRDRDAVAYERIRHAFDKLWQSARALDPEWLDAYADRARTAPHALPPGEVDAEALAPIPPLRDVQIEALAALRKSREQGHRRALVVLATGLGKTWLAAFDYRQLREEIGARPRLLFLAHRRELLRQAAATYRRLLREVDPRARVSWFLEDESDLAGDLVFASVAKLARQPHLERLRSQRFDYVVVDEVHHAAAASYRRILDVLDPSFLLGLTATPDRADAADILGLFDDHIAYRADVARGVASKHLAPFHYHGVKDDIDYANIPWRNRRFDPEVLAREAQTEARMTTLWRAWQAHPGRRTLVFCCSIPHAEYVRAWLRERGARVAAVFSAEGSDDREASLEHLAAGALDAVCAVDVFNEGIDVPSVDRVIMLRPTESSLLFLQQLGRGLRASHDKPSVTILDFVGNHRIFLDRIRALLSIAGGSGSLRTFLEATGLAELPAGCSVELELEAKDMLSRLFRVGGADEVERAYRELRLERGERPSAGELQRMGFLPSRLRERHGSWFFFVRAEGDLDDESEQRALDLAEPFLREVEATEMTKCFKMITLEALLEDEAFLRGLSLRDLARKSHAILRRSPELWSDVLESERHDEIDARSEKSWLSYWRKNPIDAWIARKRDRRAWFRIDAERFVLDLAVDPALEPALSRLTRELVDYRLAQYRARIRQTTASTDGFVCKVLSNQRDPILKLPPRHGTAIPQSETDARLPDGSVWQFKLMKEFCNVARPAGARDNHLPDLLRRWFGPRAGQPGTAFEVRFRASPDGFWVEPVHGAVRDLAPRVGLITYPDLRAAAGHTHASHDALDPERVHLPVDAADPDLFAVRVSGSSMDGGKSPLRDGDWAVLRLARSAPGPAMENRVVLIELPGEAFGTQYQLKRLVRGPFGWLLTSDNSDGPTLEGRDEMSAIARLERSFRPEDLAPSIGTDLTDAELYTAFGLDHLPGQSGRHAGHLFIFIDRKGLLIEPDRLQYTPPSRRPAETAYVLARHGTAWRFLGVAHQLEEPALWSIPPIDFTTWRVWGSGRDVSRRLPDHALARAQLAVDALLALAKHDQLLEQPNGTRARILGRAPRGGLRIGGTTPAALKPRTISLVDIAWTAVADDSVRDHGGLLTEDRVNQARYLEGTPKPSTRWIDTAWAIAAWTRARDLIRAPLATGSPLQKVHRSDGTSIDASFRVERIGSALTVVIESRGGTRGSKAERNVDYSQGLELRARSRTTRARGSTRGPKHDLWAG